MKTYHYMDEIEHTNVICRVDIDEDNHVVQVFDTERGASSFHDINDKRFRLKLFEDFSLNENIYSWDWVIISQEQIITIRKHTDFIQ